VLSDPGYPLLVRVAEEDTHNGRVTDSSAYGIRRIVAESPEGRFCRWRQSVGADEDRFFFR